MNTIQLEHLSTSLEIDTLKDEIYELKIENENLINVNKKYEQECKLYKKKLKYIKNTFKECCDICLIHFIDITNHDINYCINCYDN